MFSVPLSQVYKDKRVAMQSRLCERISPPKDLTEFKRGDVIGCHCCSKSVYEMSRSPSEKLDEVARDRGLGFSP